MSTQTIVSIRYDAGNETEAAIDPNAFKRVERTEGSVRPLSKLADEYLVRGTGEWPAPPRDNATFNGLIAARTIIGEDDRIRVRNTEAFPWCMICSLKIFGVDGNVWFGTGWIAGPQTVITAGHCVYHQHNLGGWAERVVVVPAQDDDEQPFGTFESHSFSTTKAWKEAAEASRDIAAIHLAEPLPEELGHFAFSDMPDQKLNNQRVNTSGYPRNKGGGNQMWHGRDRICQVFLEEIYYETDTEKGQSGAPVYLLQSDKTPLVVGIHAYGLRPNTGGNSATRINAQVFALLRHWVGEKPVN